MGGWGWGWGWLKSKIQLTQSSLTGAGTELGNRIRSIRRGGRQKRKNKDIQDMKIMHMNCDGFTSKSESIGDIIKEKQTDVLLLNETNLKGRRKVK